MSDSRSLSPLSARIRDELRELDQTTQLVFVLRDVHDISVDRIATGTGLAYEDVKRRLHQARLAMMRATGPSDS